ncbi:MAG: alpha/beta fold hydrolase [Lachnospiraceae bacterium]|nr:alpha/beta fold hydrolase [Lachnospiraceae bacterium]
MNIRLLPDNDHYSLEMQEMVIPCLEERKRGGSFEAAPHEQIYFEYYRADNAKGTIVMLHGFSESVDKFRETVWYFLQNGYNVWLMEHRGHGRSFRCVKDPSLVHIPDYRSMLRDLRYFVSKIVIPAKTTRDKPLYLFAHSMGGGLGACYLERYPDDFSKAILSSPMLEIDASGIPVWLMRLFANANILLQKGDTPLPGSSGYQSDPDFENSCSNCLARYTWYHNYTNANPQFQTCVVSIQTALQFLKITKEATNPKNCERVKANVLLLQAGKDTTVRPGGQEAFIRQIGKHGRLVHFANAKHEIFMGQNADLEAYYREIFSFL